MEPVHRILAYVVVVAVLVGVGWSVLAIRRPDLSHYLGRFQIAIVVLFGVSAVVGLAVLATGVQPKEGLHFVYAAIGVAALPLARSFVPSTDRHAPLATVAAFVVLAFVLYRLFVTG